MLPRHKLQELQALFKGFEMFKGYIIIYFTFSIFVQAPVVISTVTMIFSGPKGKQKVHKTLDWVLQQEHGLLWEGKMYSLIQHSFVLWISKVTIVYLSMYYLSIIYLCIYLASICMYMCSLCVCMLLLNYKSILYKKRYNYIL